MNFADRLNDLMAMRGYNPTSLSKACGFGNTAIRDLIQGQAREPLAGRLYKIAEVLQVRMEDLLGSPYLTNEGDGHYPDFNPDPSVKADDADIVYVPEYDVQLAAGAGKLPSVERVKDQWPFSRRFLTSEIRADLDQISVVEVVGDSMSPILQPHDRIIVNHADVNPTPPGIFALWDGYGLVVKKVQRVHGSDPARFMLISENPTYPPYEVLADEITIVGRVAWYSRRI